MGSDTNSRRENPQLAFVPLEFVAKEGAVTGEPEVDRELAPLRRRHKRVTFLAMMIRDAVLGHLHIEYSHTQVQAIENEVTGAEGP